MNELSLFAGAGGGILGGKLLGWRCVCAVELDPYARAVLAERQNDGCLPPFPIWDDIRTFDGRPWRGLVDVVSGGFPCQDISVAGKGAGLAGARSGLWRQMARVIREVRPSHVFMENSPALTARGLGHVLFDLAALGYDAKWGVHGAHHAGAPHKRDRIWIVAHAGCVRQLQPQGGECEQRERPGDRREALADTQLHAPQDSVPPRCGAGFNRGGAVAECRVILADAEGPRLEGHRHSAAEPDEGCREGHPRPAPRADGAWWEAEPAVGRVVDGLAHRVDRLRCLGNGQVPAVVRLAWETLNA